MHCNQEQIEALLDGELVGPEQDAVLSHLRDCPGCRRPLLFWYLLIEEYQMKKAGAEDLGFNTIIASGLNSSTDYNLQSLTEILLSKLSVSAKCNTGDKICCLLITRFITSCTSSVYC